MSLTLCLVSLKELMPVLQYLLDNGRVVLDEWEEDHANGKIYWQVGEWQQIPVISGGQCTSTKQAAPNSVTTRCTINL
jgi:hypothetical protein